MSGRPSQTIKQCSSDVRQNYQAIELFSKELFPTSPSRKTSRRPLLQRQHTLTTKKRDIFYTVFTDDDTACFFILDSNGTIHSVTPQRTSLFDADTSNFIGKSFFDLLDKKSLRIMEVFLKDIFSNYTPWPIKILLRTKGGRRRTMRVEAQKGNSDALCQIMVLDITEYIRNIKKATAYAERLKKLLDRKDIAFRHLRFAMDSAPVGILCIDKNGSFKYFNKTACELFGYSHDAFAGRCFFDLFTDYTPITWTYYWELLKHQQHVTYLYPFTRPDGIVVMFEFQCVFFSLEGYEGVYTFVRDVTERLKAQQELEKRERDLRLSQEKLRRLSVQVINAQDQERRRLARELHDDLGQALALLKVRLAKITHKIGSLDTSLYADCRDTSRYVEQIIENVRRLSRDLSPSIIEDLGLIQALKILFKDFTWHNRLRVKLYFSPIDHLLGLDAQINLYRFCQEVLTNIQKHARAQTMSVKLTCRSGTATLQIKDDGIGFDVDKVLHDSKERGMGLTTLRERAGMLSGTCTITSAPGRGTCVSLCFPVGERHGAERLPNYSC